jgi:hypothetical protein
LFIEKEKCIPFDVGILHKIKRQIIIRIHWNNTTYTFESDLDALKKIADGHRHRVNEVFFFCKNLIFYEVWFSLVSFHNTSSSWNDYKI